jgi:hypothetical protein
LRYPGSLTLEAPGTGQRREFLSAYDVRAVRSCTTPVFGEAELRATIRYGWWMGIVLQHWADLGVSRSQPVAIDCFDRSFHFEEWQQTQ